MRARTRGWGQHENVPQICSDGQLTPLLSEKSSEEAESTRQVRRTNRIIDWRPFFLLTLHPTTHAYKSSNLGHELNVPSTPTLPSTRISQSAHAPYPFLLQPPLKRHDQTSMNSSMVRAPDYSSRAFPQRQSCPLVVQDIVHPGQTISSTKFERRAGGKGANQAAAVARAGGAVSLVGAIGEDGTWLVRDLEGYGVSTTNISVVQVLPISPRRMYYSISSGADSHLSS